MLNLREKFGSRAAAAGLLAGALTLMPFQAAHAGPNDVCKSLDNVNGHVLPANFTAGRITRATPGLVGVSAYPGPDVGQTPGELTLFLRQEKLSADCFINNKPINGATSYRLYVAGEPVEYAGRNTFTANDLRREPKILGRAKLLAQLSLAGYGDEK